MANSGKKTCFDAGKIGFCHCAAVLQAQVPKLCTDLDLSLLYILILGTYSKFARKINFLALGVYCPAGQSAFRRSRPQLKLGEEIDSSRLVDDYACKNPKIPNTTLDRFHLINLEIAKNSSRNKLSEFQLPFNRLYQACSGPGLDQVPVDTIQLSDSRTICVSFGSLEAWKMKMAKPKVDGAAD